MDNAKVRWMAGWVLTLHISGVGCGGAQQPASNNKPPRTAANDSARLDPRQVAARVAALRDQLKNADIKTAVKAADGLADLGHRAAAGVPDLIDLLHAEDEPADPALRRAAARALGAIGPPAHAPLATLINGLNESLLIICEGTEEQCRPDHEAQEEGVARYAPVLIAAGAALVPALLRVREGAIDPTDIIAAMGKAALPALRRGLADDKHDVRGAAVRAMAALGPRAAAAAPDLGPLLRHKESYVRKLAARALISMGDKAVPVLVAALGVKAAREEVMAALGKLGQRAVPALIRAIEDAGIRAQAVTALGLAGHKAAPAIPKVIAAAADRSVAVRAAAALTLGQVCKDVAVAAPTLMRGLRDRAPAVRKNAARALGMIKARQPRVVQGLTAAARHKDAGVRASAAWSLGEVGAGQKSVIGVLVAGLKDRSTTVRANSAEALGKQGVATPAVASGLTGALKDEDAVYEEDTGNVLPVVAIEAARALGKLARSMKGNARTPVDGLRRSLSEAGGKLALAICNALGSYGPRARRAIPDIIAALEPEDDPCVGEAGVRALGQMGKVSAKHVAFLIQSLQRYAGPGESCDVSAAANDVLSTHGAAAVPALKKALKSKDDILRSMAAELLKTLR